MLETPPRLDGFSANQALHRAAGVGNMQTYVFPSLIKHQPAGENTYGQCEQRDPSQ
ncbi:hypothetical protein D3C81_2184290 [compost metagenome]